MENARKMISALVLTGLHAILPLVMAPHTLVPCPPPRKLAVMDTTSDSI